MPVREHLKSGLSSRQHYICVDKRVEILIVPSKAPVMQTFVSILGDKSTVVRNDAWPWIFMTCDIELSLTLYMDPLVLSQVNMYSPSASMVKIWPRGISFNPPDMLGRKGKEAPLCIGRSVWTPGLWRFHCMSCWRIQHQRSIIWFFKNPKTLHASTFSILKWGIFKL